MDTVEPSTEPAPPSAATAPTTTVAPSFGKLAKRIASVASNLLAMALVLILMLTLGREVISWWRADSQPSPGASSASSDAHQLGTNAPMLVGVGQRGAPLQLQRIPGDRAQAVAALATMGLAAAAKGELASLPTLQPAEQKLLDQCQRATPISQADGASAYEVRGDLPMVVVVRDKRVVFCGIGLAAGADAWSLYGLPLHAARDVAPIDTIPLPPGAQRVLSLANSAPASTLVFRGAGPLDAWRQHYEQWFTGQQWQTLQPWHAQGEIWQAMYVSSSSPARQVVLQLSPDREPRHWNGLLVLTTSPPRITE